MIRSLAIVLVLLLSQLPAARQPTAAVRGTVVDAAGAAVAGARITATNEQTGETINATTNEAGEFQLVVAFGRYTVTAVRSGFGRREVRGLSVTAGAAAPIRIQLDRTKLGGIGTAKTKPPPPKPTPAPPEPVVPTSGAPPPMTTTDPGSQSAPGALWWNAWPDAYPGPKYEPLKHLKRNTEYLLVLHLSGLKYQGKGLSATPASGDITAWKDDWLKTAEIDAKLQVLLLPDSNYFTVVDRRVDALPVDLKKMRDWAGSPAATIADPLAEIRAHKDFGVRPFVFGSVALRFKTSGREGVGAMALSIWSDIGRPLDEIALSYCVSDAPADSDPPVCHGLQPVQPNLKGIDSVRVAAEGRTTPDAALHFLELDQRGVIGVFRENNCGDCTYKVWELGTDGASLRQYLANTTLPAFGPAATTTSLAEAGRDLYNLLFPLDENNQDRIDARAAFERFVERDIYGSDIGRPTRSIFVRALLTTTGVAQPVYLPLGLITIPSAPAEFVGFRYRIEIPLERQSYRASTSCISRWFFALPPSTSGSSDELPMARQRFDTVMTQWEPEAQRVFPTIPDLRTWLQATKPPESSAAVVVVSHHDQNALYFDPNEKLTAKQVQRLFGETTLLILNGCSTGSPMALELIRQFNERGVAATIASHVAIRPQMAGDFMATLGEIVSQTESGGISVADLFFRAVTALKEKRPDDMSPAYGARALVFSLLGNGAIRVCVPRKDAP